MGAVMVGLRLFLSEGWTSDTARLDRAGVPEDRRVYRSKPEIALAEIDRVRAAGARFGCVLADAGYVLSGPFRQGLSERGLTWAVGIPYKQKVYPANVPWSSPSQGGAAPGSTMCLTQNRQVRRRCWKPQNGARSVGDVTPKARSQLALLLFAFAWPMARHSAFTTREASTCPARRSGLLANIVRPESANSISPTCPPTHLSSSWPGPSRRAGSANRPTSN